jgi:hypothetical protein
MYPIFVTISLLLVAGSSVYMSVYGLMSVFVSNASVIVCMGLGMEIGKILTVAHLYRNWPKLGSVTKILYVLIVSVLVLLTSIEVIGFLSLSHANATQNLRATETALKGLKKEAAILQKQMLTTDTTLAGLPTSHVTRRIKERNASGYGQKQARLLIIAKQQTELETRFVKVQASSGPIFAVAKILKIHETDAIAMLILILVLVLEPLSIGLTVATSAAWMTQNIAPEEKPQSDPSSKELMALKEQYNFSVGQLVSITGRKKPKTCEAWLNGTTPVPKKALQAVRAWVNSQSQAVSVIN